MKKKAILVLALGIGLALALGLVAGLALARDEASTESDTAPTVVSYQGEVRMDDQPYNGTGHFKFAVVDASGNTTYWSNDGSSIGGSEPTTPEALTVADGLFAVLLGNPAAPYSMPPITASVFADKGRRLHVWFDADGVAPFTDLGLTVVAAVPYALNAETLDGKDGSYYDQHYDHVIVVAKSGGDYTTVSDALDDISGNGPNSRYLVWVTPGTYTETITMKEYVDIEGASELLTIISYTGSAGNTTGTVVGADNSELRFLTVRNTGGNTEAIAIFNSYASPRFTHVTVSASGGNINRGVFTINNSTPTMAEMTISATGGSYTYGVFNSSYSTPTLSMLDVSASGGTTSNYGVYNTSHASLTMVDVNTSASGGNGSDGVYNHQSSVTLTRVTASASGSSFSNYGIYNDTSAMTMTDVIASGLVGAHNNGVFNKSSSITIRNSKLTASGSDSNGLYNTDNSSTYTVTVDNCQITGDTYSLQNDVGDDNFTTYVGASLLDGAVTGSGTEICVFSYDGDYAALETDCLP